MNKTIKNTVIIIIIIMLSIGLGFVYEQVSIFLNKKAHPLKYEDIVEKYSAEYGVPREIIYGVIKAESGFRSDVVSSAGAVGLMQIMPGTFKDMAGRLKEDVREGLLYDPHTNIKYGTFYLRHLYDDWGFKDWNISVAAYNAGPSNVRGWLSNPEYTSDGQLVNIPFEETRNYVKRVKKNADNYKKLYFSKEK